MPRRKTLSSRAYIAGFFDGEGSITIAKSHRGTSPIYWLVVCLTNKNLAVLQWVQTLYGGRLSTKPRRSTRWAEAYTLTINKKTQTRTFLESVLPFARIKRAQIEHGLAFLSLPPKQCRYEKRVGSWPLKVVNGADLNTRESMKLRMNNLNRRGPVVFNDPASEVDPS